MRFSLLLAVLTWGIEYPLLKRCSVEVGFLTTGAVMFALGAVLLGITEILRRLATRARSEPASEARPWGMLVLIGVLGVFVNFLGLWGVKLTSVANASTLARSDVLFSLVLSASIFHEAIERWALLFVPPMLLGICLLTGFLVQSPELGRPGDYLMLASAFCVSLNAFVIKRVVQRASPVLVGFCNSGLIGLSFVAAAVARRGWAASFGGIPRLVWGRLLALVALSYVFFIAYNTALRTVPVWKVRLMCLVIPVVATLFGWAFLDGERPTPTQWMGMVLICSGAAGITVAGRLPARVVRLAARSGTSNAAAPPEKLP